MTPLLPDMLRLLLEELDRHKNALHLLLVVNTKNAYSLPEDYKTFSVTTEYLSDSELSQLINGFRDAGILTDVHVGEKGFASELFAGSIARSAKHLLVYSTVSSGIWHGRDTLVAALCGLASTPIGYCGSDAYAMGVAGNKYYALRLAERLGETAGTTWLYKPQIGWCNDHRPQAGQRVILKPALECASIGIDDTSIQVVDEHLDDLLEERSRLLSQPILVQPLVEGYEIEVPVFGAPAPIAPAAFGIEVDSRPFLGDTILTYERIFREEYSYYPLASFDAPLERALRRSACRIFNELNLYGFARIDFRVTAHGVAVVTDINAIPHLTPNTSPHMAFATLGLSYPVFISLVAAAGLQRSLALQRWNQI